MFDNRTRPMIRLVNYHHTPPSKMGEFEAQLAYWSKYFSNVTPQTLDEYIQTGRFPGDRLGLIPAFYNGYRDNFDVIAPILDKLGMIGWFFVVTDPIDLPPEDQAAFGRTHKFSGHEKPYADGREVMSRQELLELSGRHIICSHTASHITAIGNDCPYDVARREIVGSAEVIRDITGITPPAFCWLFGEPYDSRPGAHELLREAGYQFLFGSRMIERIR